VQGVTGLGSLDGTAMRRLLPSLGVLNGLP
jgi:hypothetical protein